MKAEDFQTPRHKAARPVTRLTDGNNLHFLLQEGISDLLSVFKSNLLESAS